MNSLSQEQQAKLEQTKIHFETLRQLMLARTQVIITCTSLIAAILIVATFGETFIQETETLKWTIIFLMNLIPISLFDYSFKLNKGEISTLKEIDPAKLKTLQRSPIVEQAIRRSDLLYTLLISLSILLIINLIIEKTFYTLLIGTIDFAIIYIMERYS